jgi:hypothetical protein
VADLEQFTLNSLVAPTRVLPCHPFNQIGQRRLDRRTPLAMRVSPVPGNQPAMPAQECSGCDESMAANRLGSRRLIAAKNARSFQFNVGLGFCRRSTATSWRRTRSSASLEADERASNAIQLSSRMKIR